MVTYSREEILTLFTKVERTAEIPEILQSSEAQDPVGISEDIDWEKLLSELKAEALKRQ
jgi:hypothetical protein